MPERPTGWNEDVAACLRVLAHLVERPSDCDTDPALERIREQSARLTRVCRELARSHSRQRDRELLDTTLIHAGGHRPALAPPSSAQLTTPRACYVCQQPFRQVHFFYDSLCPTCAGIHYQKRTQAADLAGRVALVTGARVKIGYQVTLSLLRCGARVVAMTRFPRDAARRYAAEPDFPAWADRLELHGLDLRALVAVERFAGDLCRRLDRLDIVVNNAAQTIRRPSGYYRDLVRGESGLVSLPPGAERLLAPLEAISPAAMTQFVLLPEDAESGLDWFPPGQRDVFDRQVDLRETTSWTLELPQVELGELLEVHAVNCLAPFVLLRGLDALLESTAPSPRYVVNVSSKEGNFTSTTGKSGRHPHTNMTKAALNMITRTCAERYAARGIHMNSVDPGWVSNEAPVPRASEMTQAGFREPLDLIDAAARVLDPVYLGVNTGQNLSGKLLEHYREVPW